MHASPVFGAAPEGAVWGASHPTAPPLEPWGELP